MKMSSPNIWLLMICAIAIIGIFLLSSNNINNTNLFNTSAQEINSRDSNLVLLQKGKDELFLSENEYRNFLSSKNRKDKQAFVEHMNNFTGQLSRISVLSPAYLSSMQQQVKEKVDLSLIISQLKLAADTLLQQVSDISFKKIKSIKADTIQVKMLEKYMFSTVDTVKFVPVKQRKGFFKKVGELFKSSKDSIAIQHNKGKVNIEESKDSVTRAKMHALSGAIQHYYQDAIDKELSLRKKIDENERLFAQKTLRLFNNINSQINLLERKLDEANQQKKLLATAMLIKLQERKNIIIWISLVIIGCTVMLLIYSIYKALKYEKRILSEKQKAEKLVKVKSRVLSRVSHEIRSPLTTVIGFTEYMQNSKNDKDAGKYLNAIKIASDHLLSTVNDILDYSRLEAGKIKFIEEPFLLKKQLEETIEVYSLHARDKKLQLKLQCNFSEELVLCGDAFRLKQILYNLIGNAIKFTDVGSVEVSASIKQLANEKVQANFKVFDTGRGISSEHFNYIFEEFTQVTGTGNKYIKTLPGTGLGLSICKLLVELQGGNIKVESEVNKGSVFSFSIPYKTGLAEDITERDAQVYNDIIPAFDGKRILVVEDSDFNIMLLSLFLTRYGLQFDVAKDGEAALELFARHTYDLILTDIHLPKLAGYELASAIRQHTNKSKASVPIIALTANPVGEDFNLYYEHGINDIIVKPYKEIDLRARLVGFFLAGINKISEN